MDDLAAEDNPTILLSAETESDDPPVVHGEDDPVDEPVSPVPLIGQLLQVPHSGKKAASQCPVSFSASYHIAAAPLR